MATNSLLPPDGCKCCHTCHFPCVGSALFAAQYLSVLSRGIGLAFAVFLNVDAKPRHYGGDDIRLFGRWKMENSEQRDRQFPLVALVAEKDLMTRATLVTLLSCDGYRVFQEENVNAAIPCIDSTNDLAVLFVDLAMPGWKSLVRHALNMTPRAFIIAMGESDLIPDISDLEKSGIQACLNKPLMYNDLRRALSEKEWRSPLEEL